MTIVAGVDFGTASVRVSLVDDARGRIGSGAADYPVLRDARDPDLAAQRHDAHLAALQRAFAVALARSGENGREVAALAVATTGSTVAPLDEDLRPIDDYYLWCDHRAWREAAEITAAGDDLPALAFCGGAYSAEWGFAKLLHWLRHNPHLRTRMATAAEHCDVIVAMLTGVTDPAGMRRSICAMGHKWLWNADLGGLPSERVLTRVDPLLTGVLERLDGIYQTSDRVAGGLSDEWAARLKLRPGIPVPVAALDAHWDAIGVGCRRGDVVNVIGTSSCIMALSERLGPMPGIPGVVAGSIHPGYIGIEAGLAAAGAAFDAIASRTHIPIEALAAQIGGHRAGQTGLTRLVWDNGDRSVLADQRLAGMTLGWRLAHSAADELFAAIEGTAFQTRIVLDRLREHGVPIESVINAGGIPPRNPTLNRIYANVLGKPVLIPRGDTTSLGSAIFAFLAAGTFATVEEAQAALCPDYDVIAPDPGEQAIYEGEYDRFRDLYFTLSRIPAAHEPAPQSNAAHRPDRQATTAEFT
jgi:L-ribulokinase